MDALVQMGPLSANCACEPVHHRSADAETAEAIDETMRAAPPADVSEAQMASDASAMAGLSATCWQAFRSDSGLNDSSFAPAPAR